MSWNPYFELRWNAGATVRRFKLYQPEARHLGKLVFTSTQRSVDGDAITVRVTKQPRFIQGVVPFNWPASIANPDGSQIELEAACNASDLECKSYDDAAYWDAVCIFQGQWLPQTYDPLGENRYIEIRLEEK